MSEPEEVVRIQVYQDSPASSAGLNVTFKDGNVTKRVERRLANIKDRYDLAGWFRKMADDISRA